ncbi:hypothetical protein EDC04DRAFT_2601263 [Pisolithus marmoratus]|nr:hypothetical protein EDC04DRAFT_2601263 [Pisolithus marmoratus]
MLDQYAPVKWRTSNTDGWGRVAWALLQLTGLTDSNLCQLRSLVPKTTAHTDRHLFMIANNLHRPELLSIGSVTHLAQACQCDDTDAADRHVKQTLNHKIPLAHTGDRRTYILVTIEGKVWSTKFLASSNEFLYTQNPKQERHTTCYVREPHGRRSTDRALVSFGTSLLSAYVFLLTQCPQVMWGNILTSPFFIST